MLAFVCLARADEYTHLYQTSEATHLWVNKVGPYHNPQETYTFYSLPFCSSFPVEKLEHRYDWLGEVLEGNDLIASGFELRFREPVPDHTKVCSMELDEESAAQLSFAIHNHYWYQWYLDDLPIWGMVGELTTSDSDEDESQAEALLFTHKRSRSAARRIAVHRPPPTRGLIECVGGSRSRTTALAAGECAGSCRGAHPDAAVPLPAAGPRIIQVNLTSENPVALHAGAKVDLSYSVEWTETETPFSKRFDRYLDYDFFEHQIHWFSIFNSFMMAPQAPPAAAQPPPPPSLRLRPAGRRSKELPHSGLRCASCQVLFLTGIVSLILLRTLRKDYARYARDSDMEERGAAGRSLREAESWTEEGL